MSNAPTTRPRSRANALGFTLIELLIAIAVVAILAAIAFPNFMDSVRKSRRSEAFSALSAIQQAQERRRANSSSYTDQLTTAAPDGLGLASSTTAGGYYSLSIANAGPAGYEAVATAVSGTSQASDGGCAKLAVQVVGGNVRYASSSTAGSLSYAATDKCWAR